MMIGQKYCFMGIVHSVSITIRRLDNDTGEKQKNNVMYYFNIILTIFH
jgi:hypothetical protein